METKEFILDEVAKGLNLNPNRFCVLAALLGNFLLTDADLREFHKRICEENETRLVNYTRLNISVKSSILNKIVFDTDHNV